MIAFVLSGGGNLGALQVGAVRLLIDTGIFPEMLVGTSVGAVNAAFLAATPTIEGANQLTRIWKGIKKDNIYPGGPLNMAWHLATRQDSLCSRKNLAAFLQEHTPEGIRTFGDLKIPLHVVATDLLTGRRYLFGDDPNEHIIDALLASTAIPPVFPPRFYQGRLLIDGGVSDNLPIDVAVEKGASEIYALDIQRDGPMEDGHWNVVEVATLSLMNLIAQQRNRDLSFYTSYPDVNLHHIVLCASQALAFDDFHHVHELIANGQDAARTYLMELESSSTAAAMTQPRPSLMRILNQARDFLTHIISNSSVIGQF